MSYLKDEHQRLQSRSGDRDILVQNGPDVNLYFKVVYDLSRNGLEDSNGPSYYPEEQHQRLPIAHGDRDILIQIFHSVNLNLEGDGDWQSYDIVQRIEIQPDPFSSD